MGRRGWQDVGHRVEVARVLEPEHVVLRDHEVVHEGEPVEVDRAPPHRRPLLVELVEHQLRVEGAAAGRLRNGRAERISGVRNVFPDSGKVAQQCADRHPDASNSLRSTAQFTEMLGKLQCNWMTPESPGWDHRVGRRLGAVAVRDQPRAVGGVALVVRRGHVHLALARSN